MQIISALITMVFQSIGQILTLLLGWIVAAYFGRVPARQKYLFSAMGGVSLIWAAMALSLASPWIRQLIALTTSNQELPFYIHLILPLAGIGWVLLPIGNGILALYYKKTKEEPKFALRKILLGYKYTPGFALAMLLMLLSLPILFVGPMLRGWRREHMTIMIESDRLSSVLESVVSELALNALDSQLQDRPLLLRSPQALLSLFAHDLFGNWTKSRARLIRGEQFRVIVHPTDLVIEGTPKAVVIVRNILAKGLTFSEAFFTWGGDAHRLEAAINAVRRSSSDGVVLQSRLADIEKQLDQAIITFNEWEILYRQILQLRVKLLTTITEAKTTYPKHVYKYYVMTPKNRWRRN